MDLRALRYFVAAVEEGTVSAAAERCHIAQPSVSNAISQLEQEFGLTFLIRSKKGVTTTPSGDVFYTQAKSLLQHAIQMQQVFVDENEQESFSLYVSPTVNSQLLEQAILKLKQQSNVRFNLTQTLQGADIKLVNQNLSESNEWFFKLEEHAYHVLMPEGYLLAYTEAPSINDLLLQPIIERSFCEYGEAFSQFQQQAENQLNVVATVENEDWAYALVRAGIGICIAPMDAANPPPGLQYRALEDFKPLPKVTRTLGFAIAKDHPKRVTLEAIFSKIAHAVM